MPIQRPSEREQRPSALEVFTDREELLAVFERNLEKKKPEEHRVLVFHGDGGIGKTTLLQKLEQLHRQRFPQALMGRLDLAGADTTPPDLLLYRLRRLFPTIPFPSFSLALAEYGRRFHPEQVYGNDRKELLQGAGPYADALADGVEVLANLSGVGVAINVMKAAARAQRQISDWVQRRAEPWLQRSQGFSEEQLLEQLPLQWARDFRHALSSHLEQGWNDAITYSGPPPLIAFDTYETLWHSGMGRNGRRREPRERWLVDLVSELPEVLWVVGGRDRLSWDEAYDPGWSRACEQHLVGQLSDEDATSFLAKRGIAESEIVEKVVSQAAGVPFYLELEAQLYDKTPADERSPEVFGGSHQQQIDRLLTHLDASERSTLRLLSAFGIWDQELFRQAVTHFATGYPATCAAELARFWSIEPICEGRWQLHNEMAQHLQAYERINDNSQYLEVHRWGFSYYDSLLSRIDAKSDRSNAAEWLQYGLKHAWVFSPSGEWVTWLNDQLEKLGTGRISRPLLGLIETSMHKIKSDADNLADEMAILLQRKARLHRSVANYDQAEEDLRRSVAILSGRYGAECMQRVKPLNSLAGLMRYLSRYQESYDLYQESLQVQAKNNATSAWQYAFTLNDYALLLANGRDFSEAEQCYKLSLELKEAIKGPRTTSMAMTLHNLASMLRVTKRYHESLTYFKRALAIKETNLGENSISIANTLNQMGMLYTEIGEYAEAEVFLERALNIRMTVYGPDHPGVAISQTSLARLFHLTSRLSDAENLYRQSLATKEICLGVSHASLMVTLEGLAATLLERRGGDEAVILLERAIKISRNVFGKSAYNTISRLERIVQLLLTQDKSLEAKRLCKQQFELSQNDENMDQDSREKLSLLMQAC